MWLHDSPETVFTSFGIIFCMVILMGCAGHQVKKHVVGSVFKRNDREAGHKLPTSTFSKNISRRDSHDSF